MTDKAGVMSAISLEDLHEAFVTLHEEVRQEGSEFDFRYSLVDHLFTDALGWSRTVGEGHVNFEDERKDVLCYDDSDPRSQSSYARRSDLPTTSVLTMWSN